MEREIAAARAQMQRDLLQREALRGPLEAAAAALAQAEADAKAL